MQSDCVRAAEQETWMKASVRHVGSWWDDWLGWQLPRSGETRPAPKRMGSRRHPGGTPAPGDDVHQRA